MTAPEILITTSGELMVAHVAAGTEEAVEFLDSYLCNPLEVVDSGRIIIPLEEVEILAKLARERGLVIEREAGL